MIRGKKFTLYIYLDHVKKRSALKVLRKSHYFGAQHPHYIRKSTDQKVIIIVI